MIHSTRRLTPFAAALVIATSLFSTFELGAQTYTPATITPPPVQREFRGAWIATVKNIDWPSKYGLSSQEQKQELIGLLDHAVKLNLNAIILQVRPSCDALYASKLEPWSFYLSGQMGKAPQPYYDPLEFAVTEAHKRGLELHAWFNPYRALPLADKYEASKNHISRTHPGMVVKYGNYLWLDPGLKEVQDYSLRVVLDVVKRYDIDGVHFDDYFYPYKEKDAKGQEMDFPDNGSWRRYQAAGGRLARDDWRRENVNQFVQRVYEGIKASKPWVKFGVAPFGIWQPGYPPQIKGFNSYAVLYCDSRKWLANGWIDYCSPQLYWAIEQREQSYPVLLKWWLEQNTQHRNIWPGIDDNNVPRKWKPDEILNQVKLTREIEGPGAGVVHWNMKALLRPTGLDGMLQTGVYPQPALIPSSPWLEQSGPGQPSLKVESNGKVKWKPLGAEKIASWVLQTKSNGRWETHILPAGMREGKLASQPDAVALTAIDRCGVASRATVVSQSK